VRDIDRQAIIEGRDRRAAAPHSANVFLKAMRAFFEWACGDGELVEVNPTKDVFFLKGGNDEIGFHTWTEEEVERFEKRWPIGTRERLALDILLYTGFRRGDASRFGRQHVRNDVITIRTEKSQFKKQLVLPLLPPLAASIEATPTGDLTFIVSERGTPFTKESFGNWFGDTCRKAGVPGSAHGLRKAGATRAANNGATSRQLMAMYGWKREKQAEVYTRAADERRLAMEGAQKLMPAQTQNEIRPHPNAGEGGSPKIPTKSGA
jgi:integrase